MRLSLSTYTTLSFYSFTFRIECMSRTTAHLITLSSEVVVRICELSYLSTFYLPENSLIDYELAYYKYKIILLIFYNDSEHEHFRSHRAGRQIPANGYSELIYINIINLFFRV